jgi:hypothetical protein
MTEQPVSQSTTQALGGTTVVFGWVEEARVQEVLHASDGFQALLAITLAGVGGAVAAGVTLVAGVTHPFTLYLILAVAVTITVIAGLFGAREYLRYRKVRQSLGAATARVPVPVLLVTPGSPSFTVGWTAALRGRGPAASLRFTYRGSPCIRGDCRFFRTDGRFSRNNCVYGATTRA